MELFLFILEASKSLKSASVIAWQYVKTEAVPPMTLNFFHGPGGKKLEDVVSKATENFIAGIKNRIQQIELEKLREIARKEAEAKALQEKIKAEAKRKSEEVKKKEAEKLAKEAKAKQKADAQKAQAKETKKAASETKKEEVKKATKTTPKKKKQAKRKEPKKHRREDKKGTPPKAKSK